MGIFRPFRSILQLLLLFLITFGAYVILGSASAKMNKRVGMIRIVVLSTMLADSGIGEWGFAAIVEVDGRRILFDTGARPETVLKNALELGIDLSDVREVILSHNHEDHTGGLLTLRQHFAKKNPNALSVAHVGKGIFLSRTRKSGEGNAMIQIKPAYEATGGKFVEHNGPIEIMPGVWLTGPVPRIHSERNFPDGGTVKTPDGLVADTIPEDMSLVIDSDKGLVLVSGCGHAGIINTLEHARNRIRKTDVHAAIGGFHLFMIDDTKLDWTAAKLREFGLRNFMGAHCTGIEAVFHLRRQIGLTRKQAVVSSVGSSFTLDKGIDPLSIAR